MPKRQITALKLIGIVVYSAICNQSYADGFDMFGDHAKLQNQTVLAAGNVSPFSQSVPSSDDPFGETQPRIYHIDGFCFGLPGVLGDDMNGKAALLLTDKAKSVSIAEFTTSISEIKVSVRPVVLWDCGSILKAQGNDLKRRLELLDQQNKALLELLKRQEQQQ